MSEITHNSITYIRQHFAGNSPGIEPDGGTDVIVWAADNTPINVSLGGGLTVIGAVRGAFHPDIPGVVVDRVGVVPTGDGCRINVYYVPETQLSDPNDNINADDFFDLDLTFLPQNREIPIYQQVSKRIADNDPITVYQRASNTRQFQYDASVTRLTINATYPGNGSINEMMDLSLLIHTQNNKLHRIGSVWYLFKADGVKKLSYDPETGMVKYRFTYRWVYDPGVPNTLESEEFAGKFMNIGANFYANAWVPSLDPVNLFVPDTTIPWVVLPHHSTDAISTDDPTQLPVISVAPLFKTGDAPGGPGLGQGFTILPGIV